MSDVVIPALVATHLLKRRNYEVRFRISSNYVPLYGLNCYRIKLTLALTKGAAKAASSAKWGKINSPSKSGSADRVLRRELDQALAVSPASAPALGSDSDESQENCSENYSADEPKIISCRALHEVMEL